MSVVRPTPASPGHLLATPEVEDESTAYVGVGSNVGEAKASTIGAIRSLASRPGLKLLKASSLYETDPVDCPGAQDKFVNAAVKLGTRHPPQELLRILREIESDFGRIRNGEKNSPRTLDLDLLLYEQKVLETDGLSLPHPRMRGRAFVLVPLAEIDDALRMPDGQPIADLLAGCPKGGVRRLEAIKW